MHPIRTYYVRLINIGIHTPERRNDTSHHNNATYQIHCRTHDRQQRQRPTPLHNNLLILHKYKHRHNGRNSRRPPQPSLHQCRKHSIPAYEVQCAKRCAEKTRYGSNLGVIDLWVPVCDDGFGRVLREDTVFFLRGGFGEAGGAKACDTAEGIFEEP